MKNFEWLNARDLTVATQAVATTVASAMVNPDGRPAESQTVLKAGGIDLLDLMKEGLLSPSRIVNLHEIPGLDIIRTTEDGGLRIGALATLEQIGTHTIVRERYGALADAAGSSASPQIRHVATIGGNLLQRPRCWYFRSAAHHCVRKGGSHCFAFGGENQYHAIFDHDGCAIVHPSTAATALLALDARLELANAGEKRVLALSDFLLLPVKDIHRENDLRPGEILVAILLAPRSPLSRSAHLKQAELASFDWPIADVAVSLDLSADGVCQAASIVLGAVAPVPRRAKTAEQVLIGRKIDEASAQAAANAALDGTMPLSKNAYKIPLLEVLVRRAVLAAARSV